jgi:hypothetical protein
MAETASSHSFTFGASENFCSLIPARIEYPLFLP